MGVRIFHPARSRLREVWEYSEKTWGVAQADNYLSGLVAAIEAVKGEPIQEAHLMEAKPSRFAASTESFFPEPCRGPGQSSTRPPEEGPPSKKA